MKKMNMVLTGALVFAGAHCFAGDLAIEGNLNVTSNLTSWSLSTEGAAVGILTVEGDTIMNGKLTVLGPIYGNGYGLTNLNPSAAFPSNSVTADKLAANAVTSAKILDGSIIDADISAGAAIAQSKVVGLSTLATSVATHAAAVNNPHQVTALQVGAYTTNQTTAAIASALSGFNPGACVGTNHTGDVTLNGTLNMGGLHRVAGLADPQDDLDAVSKEYLRSVLLTLQPQGDLSMGSFTNGMLNSFPLE